MISISTIILLYLSLKTLSLYDKPTSAITTLKYRFFEKSILA